MTTEDTRKMKDLLYHRNHILEFDKDNEKEMLSLKNEVEATLTEKQQETRKKLSQGDQIKNELKESLFSKEAILNDKIKTEFQLFEWGNECRKLQHNINQTKYTDQIRLAKVKMQIEKEYDESLDKLKQQAKADAEKSKSTFFSFNL